MKKLVFFAGLVALCGVASAQQYVISTVAGQLGSSGYAGDGGPATSAQLFNPVRVAVDTAGNLYISDYSNFSVRKVGLDGNINSIAGVGTLGFSGDGTTDRGQFSTIHDVLVGSDGTVYIADTLNARVRTISPSGTLGTIAGNGSHGWAGDGGKATDATLNYPSGLALDAAGNLYIADYGNATVRKVTKSTGNIDTIAGIGFAAFGAAVTDGGLAKGAFLQMPFSVAVDAAGNVYIGDIGTSSIRRVGTDGRISTYVSNFLAQNFVMDKSGNIYFADYRTNTVQKILPGGTRLWIAGNGTAGSGGDGGPATAAQLNEPYGVAVDASGNVFVADASNDAVRKLTPVAFSIGAVANAASNMAFAPPVSGSGSAANAISPGEIVVLFGTGIGPANLTVAVPSGGFFPTQLAGTTVLVNGKAAPIYYTSASLVAAIVPYSVAGTSSAQIAVQYQGNTSAVFTLPVAPSAPAVFTANASGAGQAAALNRDGTLNSASNPAHAGDIVTLYVTGEGQTSPGGVDGKINSGTGTPPAPVQPVSATVSALPAVIQYAGEAPALVSGVMQVNLVVPSGFAAGNTIPVVVRVGGVDSPPVTIAVQ